jgi:nucleoside-diphosphate-sugar epimerase
MQFKVVTGSAGFIGSAVAFKLLERGDNVIGIDNHNDYYDTKIIEATKVIEGKRINLIIRLIKRMLLRFREMNFAIKAGYDAEGSKFS